MRGVYSFNGYRITFALLIGAIVVGIIFGIFPELDLQISSIFYDIRQGTFPAASSSFLNTVRSEGVLLTSALALCLVTILITNKFLLRASQLLPSRHAFFLLAVYILGPGLLVNGIAKSISHRPRPYSVTQFNGPNEFVAWWDRSGACKKNCSFSSGEASTAAWIIVAAIVLPTPHKIIAVTLSIIIAGALSFLRLSFGGHFMSDVLFGILTTLIVASVTYPLFFDPLQKNKREFIGSARSKATIALSSSRGITSSQVLSKAVRINLLSVMLAISLVFTFGWAFSRDPADIRDLAIYCLFLYGALATMAAMQKSFSQ